MKQIVIISGKGGTGKTILTASFASLAKNKVMADCDVDAADLYLLLHPNIKETHKFTGLPKAKIDQKMCTGCGECINVCRYKAIIKIKSENNKQKNQNRPSDSLLLTSNFYIDPVSCEGCKLCMYICPAKAISIQENVSGEWYISETKYGFMVHAKLGIAEENSGKLVTIVRQNARNVAEKDNLDYIIIDGPPGIGCPVIASLSNVNIALVVTEPTLSGIHDMQRVISVAKHFGINVSCLINKYDINLTNSKNIETWCKNNNLPLLGKIPFDLSVTESIVNGVPFIEYTENKSTKEIENIWRRLNQLLLNSKY